ncbi:MAG: elongation factor G [Shewanella sp.]|nr:elongation factor G [Shewanella sp.]MCF1429309.1 elongation factor G [Shewanella sp.]MCF1437757.1 elongation factor G [Shewanella sp.]MCF1456543.1 elongation factor G [Shewanella sp.]
MAEYRTGQIRNFAVLGHTGAGKSSLLEALLYGARTIAQKGRVDKGTNHADFTPQEKAHQHSLEPSFLNIDLNGHHINLIDTPGLPDFFGRALQPLPAVESVLLVINAANGIESVTARAFSAARAQGKVVMLVINHIDGNETGLEELLDDIQRQFGPRCLPVNLPGLDGDVVDCYLHSDFHASTLFSDVFSAQERLVETVLEEDDQLMELYLEQGECLTSEQLHEPLESALRMGHLVPVCFTSAETDTGIAELLELLIQLMPNPTEGNPPQFVNGFGEKARPVAVSAKSTDHVLAHVFRVNIDPYFGRMAIMRVYQGLLTNGMKLFAGVDRKPFKVMHLLSLQGDKQVEMGQAVPGDICAIVKIDELEVGSVLHDCHDEDEYHLPALALPQPIFGLAVSSKRRGDEQKIAEVLGKLMAEDPSLSIARNEAEGQTVLQGLGDMHLQIALEKALQVFKVDMDTQKPAVAYRETILEQATSRYRHKKQSGGAGQFAEVELRVEPLSRGEGFKFKSKVVGGAIPGQYIPAVEKGVREAMRAGELAGFPVEDIKVTVLDGKHHSVDSKEIAFVMAGKKAFMDAVEQANPVILEPIVQMQIKVDSAQVGDITGDISSRRGMVCGTESENDGSVVVSVEAPLATVDDFATRLKSITGGEGEYTMVFARYEPVPDHIQQQIVVTKV